MRRGRGLQQYWHVSAACSLVELKMDHIHTATARQTATDRVAKLYQRILDSWEKESIAQRPVVVLPSVQPVGAQNSWYYSANVLGVSASFTTN